jgi:hypothetical protein
VQDEPGADEILGLVASFLRDEAAPALSGRVAFHARVAANAVDLVRRQMAQGAEGETRELARLQAMFASDEALSSLNARLAEHIASGALTLQDNLMREHLWRTTLEKLAVDQPNYASFKRTLVELKLSGAT